MSEDDIKQLLAPPDERAALLMALRRQQGFGNLGMLTGDKVLAPFGAAQVRQAQVGADNALQSDAELRRQQQYVLGKALEAQRLAAENNRRAQEAATQRDFQAEQNRLGRDNALRAAAISAGNAQAREVRAEERQLAREARKADADK